MCHGWEQVSRWQLWQVVAGVAGLHEGSSGVFFGPSWVHIVGPLGWLVSIPLAVRGGTAQPMFPWVLLCHVSDNTCTSLRTQFIPGRLPLGPRLPVCTLAQVLPLNPAGAAWLTALLLTGILR